MVSSPHKQRVPAPKSRAVQTCPSHTSGTLPTLADVERLRKLTDPHVDSFNYFLEEGLSRGFQGMEPAEIALADPTTLRDDPESIDLSETTTVRFWIEGVKTAKPVKGSPGGRTREKLLPRECRERSMMYAGTMRGMFCYCIVDRRNGMDFPGKTVKLSKEFGDMPIMVMSTACHLHKSTPKQLAVWKEELNEAGGYFIVNGIERCVRLLQIPRRNFPTAIQRSNYKNRGSTFTDLGVAMRCAMHTGDQSSITNTLHYLTTGSASLRFVARKQEFLIPVVLILRALSAVASPYVAAGSGITDEELYHRIVQGDDKNTFLVARVGLLLQDTRARFGSVNSPEECLAYIGSRFRRLSMRAETTSDIEVGHYIMRQYILIHLPNYQDKLECMLMMLRKLYAFAAGDCGIDNADSLQNQEILLPGHLMCSFVKEKFDEFLQNLRLGLTQQLRREFAKTSKKLLDPNYWVKQVDRFSGKSSGGIGKKVAHFLSTGNIVSTTGLDLMQVSGYTIVAERLNFLRYCAHFRSVHRGQFFLEMKTTAVRKLLPDQWGFLCPVHTPDGGPCGLLGHLAIKASIMTFPASSKGMKPLDQLLYSLGVVSVGAGGVDGSGRPCSTHVHLVVCIDGRIIGGASPSTCKTIASQLRAFKVQDSPAVPPTTEVAFVPPGNRGSPYPGLYLFTGAARMVRPVLQRATGRTEYIGPLEQGFMDIACLDEDIREGITTHREIDPTNMLSLIANLTPFSDQNQSPRNMYQCQMGKQTMGTPALSLPYRSDNKLYRLLTPQAPLVQTAVHSEYKMDEYPNGTNAIVAVISYTGYDMEDSVILNKASLDRGFTNATVTKTIEVNLKDEAKMSGHMGVDDARFRFSNKLKDDGKPLYPTLDEDGMPRVGEWINEGEPLYCVVDSVTNVDRVAKHKDREIAHVQSVRAIGTESGKPAESKAAITLRFPREPAIGDKFSSRHGQKGVMSIVWPQEDMPFTESGMTPDILFNPHGFPSRMTIGMLVEMMAAKSGSLHGHYQNGTPFQFHESGDEVSVDYFGKELLAAGYNYYGSEPLYSGISGCVLHADLYIGVVYYQRLRHMVSDKYQVRATGPVNELTRQPIKGRKKGGGIRLGEMERDSLLSHGAAFLLHDRLINCSDKHIAYVCSRCGDMLLPTTERSALQTTGQSMFEALTKPKLRQFCRNPLCLEACNRPNGNDESIEPIIMPYVYRYLVNELAGMNIKCALRVSPV